MRVYTRFIILGLLIFSCRHIEPKNVAAIDKDSLKREELKATIINDSSEAKWIIDNNKQFWIPSQIQLKITDSIIVKAIKTNCKEYYNYLRYDSYKDFYKQYVCYIDSKGDSIIFMNAICHIENDFVLDKNNNATQKRFDWQHHLMIVDDGGDCFWSIYVNLSKKTYFRFSVNGVA